ncbi:MAG TPA: LacI family transcriptional regulator, partial [Firmicutes bacterium]|nr:LacI family transcriptional regulator [Bacillota bacterium]
DVVIVDDVMGGYQAAQYLIQLGHRNLAFIGGPADVSSSKDRYRGFEKALREYGLKCDERFVEYDDFRQDGGYRATQRLLALTPRLTAIFAANDLMAIGAMEAILDAGLRIPEDVSVVGFDDIAISSLHFMQLTTVSQPRYDIGAIAARLLLERISKKERESPRRVVLPPRLKIRKTCAPCRD